MWLFFCLLSTSCLLSKVRENQQNTLFLAKLIGKIYQIQLFSLCCAQNALDRSTFLCYCYTLFLISHYFYYSHIYLSMQTNNTSLFLKRSTKKFLRAAMSVQLIVAYLLAATGTAQALGDIPLAPSSLVVDQATPTSVTLSWEPGNGTENVFLPQKKTDQDSAFTENGTIMIDGSESYSYTFENLIPEAGYEFRIVAAEMDMGLVVASANSATAAVTTPHVPNAVAPVGLAIGEVTLTTAVVIWSPGNGTENSFALEQKTSADSDFVANGLIAADGSDEYSYTYVNLIPNTEYELRVVATDRFLGEILDSAASSVILAVTEPDPVATVFAPTNVTVDSVTTNQVTISWTAGGGDATHFSLYQSDNGTDFTAAATTNDATELSYTFGNLTPNTQYSFQVGAVNDVTSEEALADPVAATTADDTAPVTPVLVSVTSITAISATVTWAPGGGTENSFLLGKKVSSASEFDDEGILMLDGSETYSSTFVNLVPGTDYVMQIVAAEFNMGSVVASAAPLLVSLTTLNPPAGVVAPQNLTVTAITPTTVDVSWKPGNGTETSFAVAKKAATDSDFTDDGLFIMNGSTTYTHTYINLTPNTEYELRVTAEERNLGAVADSAASTVSTITTPLITNLTTALNIDELTVSWVGDASEYEVAVTNPDDGSEVNSGPITDTTFIAAGFTCGPTYEISVVGKNANGVAGPEATASQPSGNCSGNGSNTDTLVITNVTVTDIPPTGTVPASATINWDTNKPATSRVVYDDASQPALGEAPNYGYRFSNEEDSVLATSHSMTLDGLSINTTFFVRAISSASPEVVSDEVSFTTNSAGTTTATSGDTGSTGGSSGGGNHFFIGAPTQNTTPGSTGSSSGSTGSSSGSTSGGGTVLGDKIINSTGGGTNQVIGGSGSAQVKGVQFSRLDELVASTKYGERGDDIIELQTLLLEAGFFPEYVLCYGWYGPITQKAVNDYINSKTWSIDQLIAILRRGYRGELVVLLQDDLKDKDFFPDDVTSTGFFGPITEQAVNKYLSSNGSVLGQKIVNVDSLIARTSAGNRSDIVRQLQNELKRQGYFPDVAATGFYGPVTERAVELYLRYNEYDLEQLALMLASGDSGPLVVKLQSELRDLGYFPLSEELTGNFGPVTAQAVGDYLTSQ
jgi:peptidoglycan hydrolase-like protein with peptidoglycan-binding domain